MDHQYLSTKFYNSRLKTIKKTNNANDIKKQIKTWQKSMKGNCTAFWKKH